MFIFHFLSDCYFNLRSSAWNKATCFGVSPRKVASVWVVPQQLTATQDTVTRYIINQQKPAVEETILDMSEQAVSPKLFQTENGIPYAAYFTDTRDPTD